ncbi:MAG: DUF2185 domain-containing protein [Hyphomicrobiales bacterium]
MKTKYYKLKEEDLKDLCNSPKWCIATDKITVEGMKVGFMYREEPSEEGDSGWRFFSGTETQDFVDDPKNAMMFSLNTIANYDEAILPFLKYSVGTELERVEGEDTFRRLEE